MTYYRVALQMRACSTWQWKSTILSSLETLFGWIRMYQSLPLDRMRVFSSASREELSEPFVWENQGVQLSSETVAQFLQARGRTVPVAAREAVMQATQATSAHKTTAPLLAAAPAPGDVWQTERAALSGLEWKRVELERGAGGDHDAPYRFTLPSFMPQALAWVKLQAMVRNGELEL